MDPSGPQLLYNIPSVEKLKPLRTAFLLCFVPWIVFSNNPPRYYPFEVFSGLFHSGKTICTPVFAAYTVMDKKESFRIVGVFYG